jgi:hypothetical protein
VAPREPIEYPKSDLPAMEFRRRYGARIKRKLGELRCIWETTNDPCIVVDAMWLCDGCAYPRPPWLRKLASKFPIDMGMVDSYDRFDRVFLRDGRWHKDNRDIGKRPGRYSIAMLVQRMARQELRAGYSRSKPKLAELISEKLSKDSNGPQLSPDRVERHITSVWGAFHPHRSRATTKRKI